MNGAVSSDLEKAGQSDLAARFDALRIAVLQTGRSIDEARARHGDYDDMCKALLGRNPDQADTFAVLDGHYPAAIDEYDLIVITGSKFGVYEDHDWIPRTQQIVRDAVAKGIKLIGICFGHQLIAQAMGAGVLAAVNSVSHRSIHGRTMATSTRHACCFGRLSRNTASPSLGLTCSYLQVTARWKTWASRLSASAAVAPMFGSRKRTSIGVPRTNG